MRALFAIVVFVLFLAPSFVVGAPVPQSDAGSGQDAPDTARAEVGIVPDVLYDGQLLPGSDHWDHYWFEAPADTRVSFSLVGSATCVGTFLDASGRSMATTCSSARGATTYSATSRDAGLYYLRVGAGLGQATLYRFTLALGHDAPHPLLLEPPLAPGTDPTCGTGTPVTANGGASGGVVFGATKTGFRAVVAYATELPTIETITISLDGGAAVPVSDASPRREHVFILDGMPIGRTLCFTPGDGVPRAMKLVNAMSSWDGSRYTVNMLLSAAENMVRSRDILEAGLDIYAEKLYDATDGYVRAGQTIVVSHPNHLTTGTYTCFTVGAIAGNAPNCDRRVDATFSHDSCIGGAACATLDGIQRPFEFIMMNSLFDANPVLGNTLWGPNEVGTVLVHEFGHYAFGGADLYVAGDCFDETLSLSLMGGSRAVTEFDDEVHRCPNEANLNNYIPTWTRMRWRFTEIPDRTGPIDEGPHGGGAAYARHTLAFAPTTDAAEDEGVPQDDAGTGADAGSTPATAVPIEPGVLYDGMLYPTSDRDAYKFEIAAGQTFDAVVYPAGTCHGVTNAQSIAVGGATCSTDGTRTWVRGVAPEGPLFIRIGLGSAPLYKVGVGVDGPAPTLAAP